MSDRAIFHIDLPALFRSRIVNIFSDPRGPPDLTKHLYCLSRPCVLPSLKMRSPAGGRIVSGDADWIDGSGFPSTFHNSDRYN